MGEQLQRFFDFGPFRLDVAEHVLLRDGEPVPLTRKAFEMLVVLVEHRGRLVEKEYLIKTLWPDTVAGDSNLNSNVSTLRKALGREGHRYIETVPTRGYRFKVPGGETVDEGDEVVLERHTLTRVITEEEEQTNGVGDVEPAPKQLPTAAGPRRSARRGWGAVSLSLGLLCLLLAGSAVLYRSRTSEARRSAAANVAGRTAPRSLAVLPFKTLGAAGDDEYLGLGMSDALITRLGNVRQIVVRPTSAIRGYTGGERRDPAAAGREQGVDAVLDGSVQRADGRIRVTVQLVRVEGEEILWAEQFDERFTDIFAVQDSISRQVMRELLVELQPEDAERLGRHGSENIEAYQAYLKGLYFWNKRTNDGYLKAVKYFRQAVEIDPTDARAHVGLGNAQSFLGPHEGLSEDETFSRARAEAQRALELDETLAEAHAALGLIAMNFDWDWHEAEKEFRRAIELNPNYATAHHWYGEFLVQMGRSDEGIAEARRAQELDPLSLIINTDVAKVYMFARRHDEAIEHYRRALEMDPEFETAHGLLAMTYSAKGMHEEAVAELRKIKNINEEPMYLSFLGYVYGKAGRRVEARGALDRMRKLSERTRVSPLWWALAYAGGEEKEQAFHWLGRVFAERASGGAISLKVSHAWDSLRPDPRFTDLLRRAGF
jgi:TolB-like protein/DNA-binding winged helix-turn-helix (wHTH) protein/Flp pilus assembly protein TadD